MRRVNVRIDFGSRRLAHSVTILESLRSSPDSLRVRFMDDATNERVTESEIRPDGLDACRLAHICGSTDEIRAGSGSSVRLASTSVKLVKVGDRSRTRQGTRLQHPSCHADELAEMSRAVSGDGKDPPEKVERLLGLLAVLSMYCRMLGRVVERDSRGPENAPRMIKDMPWRLLMAPKCSSISLPIRNQGVSGLPAAALSLAVFMCHSRN